ncbi:MAG: T9SS type A sorting domain-containing protein [bacterium]
MKKSLVLVALVLASFSILSAQTLLVENFDNALYTIGATLDTTFWKLHSGTVLDSIAAGLTYPGYPGSGIGNSVKISNGGSADYNRTFTAQTSGSLYASFLVNVSNASSTGRDYFIHYGENPFNTSNFRLRVFCQKNTGDSVAFGLSFASESSTATPFEYSLNTTYLFVMKLIIGPGATDDSVRLYIFKQPSIPSTEPATAQVGTLGSAAAADLVNYGSIALRQGSGNTPTLRVDGIRVSKTWSPLFVTSVERIATEALPTAFVLQDNYPNPFNPATTISYQLASSGVVRLSIFDITGKEVTSLVNEVQEAGHYLVHFNATMLSSGTYLYRLQAGSYISTKKMILMK